MVSKIALLCILAIQMSICLSFKLQNEIDFDQIKNRPEEIKALFNQIISEENDENKTTTRFMPVAPTTEAIKIKEDKNSLTESLSKSPFWKDFPFGIKSISIIELTTEDDNKNETFKNVNKTVGTHRQKRFLNQMRGNVGGQKSPAQTAPQYSTALQFQPKFQSSYSSRYQTFYQGQQNQPQYGASQQQYAAPQPQYAAPQQQYAAPQPQYAAPQQQYAAPQPQYSAPQPQYSAPQQQYAAPQPQYSAPQQQFSAPPQQYEQPQQQFSSPPQQQFSAPPQQYEQPQQQFSAPPQQYEQTQQQFSAPPQQYEQPQQQFSAPPQQYEQPQQQYGAPQQQYGAPQQQYEQPQQQYGAPQQQYGAPQQQYGAPQQQYGAPQQQYGAPQQQYGASQQQYGAPQQQFEQPGQAPGPLGPSLPLAPQLPVPFLPVSIMLSGRKGSLTAEPVIETSSYGPVQQAQAYSAPVQQQQGYSSPAPVQQQESYSAPVQQQESYPAPVQQQESYSAPVQQQSYQASAPVQQQSYQASAPVQQQHGYASQSHSAHAPVSYRDPVADLPNTCSNGLVQPIYEDHSITETYCRCHDGSYGYTCSEGFSNPCNGYGQYHPADSRIPNNYFIECSWNTPYLMKCAKGTVWNQNLLTCDWTADATHETYGGHQSYGAQQQQGYGSPAPVHQQSYQAPVSQSAY